MTMALAQRAWPRPEISARGSVRSEFVSADDVFAGGVNPRLRDALYQWYEQRGVTVDVFGPFAIEAVAYARRIARADPDAGQVSADDAYRRGDCVECAAVPHLPGMLRCATCQRRYLNRRSEGR